MNRSTLVSVGTNNSSQPKMRLEEFLMGTLTSQLNSISASTVIILTLKVFGCFFFRPRIDIFFFSLQGQPHLQPNIAALGARNSSNVFVARLVKEGEKNLPQQRCLLYVPLCLHIKCFSGSFACK